MIKGGANNRDVKKINRIRTMRSIFACERISQPELAAKVGNSWPTVLQNVKELMEMGLVQEVGTFESTGGRKAKAFAPVRNARYAVGLEITQNHIGAVLVDLSGELVRFERKKRPFERCDAYAAGKTRHGAAAGGRGAKADLVDQLGNFHVCNLHSSPP